MKNQKHYEKIKAKFEKVSAQITPEHEAYEISDMLFKNNLEVFHIFNGKITEVTKSYDEVDKPDRSIRYNTSDLLNADLILKAYLKYDEDLENASLDTRFNVAIKGFDLNTTANTMKVAFANAGLKVTNEANCLYTTIEDIRTNKSERFLTSNLFLGEFVHNTLLDSEYTLNKTAVLVIAFLAGALGLCAAIKLNAYFVHSLGTAMLERMQ